MDNCSPHIITALGVFASCMKEEFDDEAILYERAARAGYIDAIVRLADTHYEKESDADAVAGYSKGARLGHARAQEMLGDCYYFGEGTGKDQETALRWYHRSVSQGHAAAMVKLGDHLSLTDRANKANELYEKASKLNNAAALVKLGDISAKSGYQRSALRFYTEAMHGNADALIKCADAIEDNSDERKVMYLEAATLVDSRARDVLFGTYTFREGSTLCKDDVEKTYSCNKVLRACALTKAGKCCEEDGVDEIKRKAAVELYTIAAELGFNEAQNCLGNCYYWGIGVETDFTTAFNWYTKAAEDGDAIGLKNAGFCYQHGNGVAKDENKAFEYYMKSAKLGCAAGEYSLAYCYEKGIGTDKNKAESKRQYEKAKRKGYKEGITGRLGRMMLGTLAS